MCASRTDSSSGDLGLDDARHPKCSRGIPTNELTLKVSPRDPSAYAWDNGNLAGVFALYPVERFFACFERAFELARFDCFEDFAELRARFHSHRD